MWLPFLKSRGEKPDLKDRSVSYRRYISEFVYGGVDGTITSFAIVAGATGAGLGLKVIIILGIGSLVADGLSMAVGSFFAKKAERDLLISENEEGRKTTASFSLSKSPVITGLVTFGSFVAVGVTPLLIYLVSLIIEMDGYNLFFLSSLGAVLGLTVVGAVKSLTTNLPLWRGWGETLLLGGITAIVAYYIGFTLDLLISNFD